MSELVLYCQTQVQALFERQDTKRLLYHDYGHTCEVAATATAMGKAIGISEPEAEVLAMAAWWHDAGYLYVYHGHEDKGIELARACLSGRLPPERLDMLAGCIAATRLGSPAHTLLEQILSDADIAYGVTRHFFERGPRLRQEWELCLNKHYTDLEWETLQADFLSQVRFHTEYARLHFAPIVAQNLERQRALLAAWQ